MPGERTPWNVPMMPEADIVAMSGSMVNQRSRNSVALIVMSCTKVDCRRCGRSRNVLARPRTSVHSHGLMRPMSGGTAERIGLMNLAISAMSWPYSS